MIVASPFWRFVEPIAERGYYDEEIVQHLMTEHRAVRRNFGEKVCNDPAAIEEVRRQLKRAGQCNPPGLPLVYSCESQATNLAVYMELVEGRPLIDFIRERAFKATKSWAPQALRLVETMLDLREAGVRFERVDIEQIVVTEMGTVRLTTRAAVSLPSDEVLKNSPVLQKMARASKLGPYVGGALQDAAEMENLALILLRMQQGENRTFADFVAESNSLSAKGNELGPVTELLLDLYTGPGGRGSLRQLDVLRDRLVEMVLSERRREKETSTPGGLAGMTPMAPETKAPIFTAPSRTSGLSPVPNMFDVARPSSSNVPTENVDANPWAVEPTPSPGSASKSDTHPPTPRPENRSSSHAGLHRPEGFPSAALNPDEVSNPYADPEPTPGAGGKRKGSSPKLERKSSSSMSTTMVPLGAPVKSRSNLPILPILLGILITGAVVAGGAWLVEALRPAPPNLPPVAVITPPRVSRIQVGDVVTISASESNDPEGQSLTYTWRVQSAVEGKQVIFTDEGARRGTRENLYVTRVNGITAQFLEAADYTFSLEVSDGSLQSPPVELTLTVEPLM